MARKVITLEIDAEDVGLIRNYANDVGEMKDLAATTPAGSVLESCENAVVERGPEHQRRLLEHAFGSQIEAFEKKASL